MSEGMCEQGSVMDFMEHPCMYDPMSDNTPNSDYLFHIYVHLAMPQDWILFAEIDSSGDQGPSLSI